MRRKFRAFPIALSLSQMLCGMWAAVLFFAAGALAVNNSSDEHQVNFARFISVLFVLIGGIAFWYFTHLVEEVHTKGQSTIAPGKYPVHTLRPLGGKVAVVITLWDTHPDLQEYRFYLLPTELFTCDVRPFTMVGGVVMVVARNKKKTFITLHRGFV